MSGNATEFERLLEDLCHGSEAAAAEIASRYTPHLLRAVRKSLPASIRPKVDSIDLVNTLWGALLVSPEQLREVRTPEQLIGLLCAAARNRVIEEYRKYTTCQARDVRREVSPAEIEQSEVGHSLDLTSRTNDTPSQIVASREKLRRLIEDLSDRDREVFLLRSQGCTYAEIAQAYPAVSERTARRVVTSFVEKLQQ